MFLNNETIKEIKVQDICIPVKESYIQLIDLSL